MIEQNVQLVRSQDDRIWVRMGSQSGCSACDSGRGCGAGLFSKLLRNQPIVIELASNGLKANPGQMITLGLQESVYIKLVMASYGWPVLAAVAGACVGYGMGAWLGLNAALLDLVTLSGGLLAGGLGARVIKFRQKAGGILENLRLSVCFLAEPPNMCDRNHTVTPTSFADR